MNLGKYKYFEAAKIIPIKPFFVFFSIVQIDMKLLETICLAQFRITLSNDNARHQLFASPRIEIINSVQVVCISKITFNTHDK